MLRQAVFNICQTSIENASFLDVFAGTGAMGLEALSRGALNATFIDQDRQAIHCIKTNIQNLGVCEKSEVSTGNAFTVLEKLAKNNRQFDIIYVDPPYNTICRSGGTPMTYSNRILHIIDASNLLAKEGILLIEEAAEAHLEDFANLKNLYLKDSRRFGGTQLLQFIPISA
jgi:16S rRNA (guanine(966)-N(2))-methyltransferase RsmD